MSRTTQIANLPDLENIGGGGGMSQDNYYASQNSQQEAVMNSSSAIKNRVTNQNINPQSGMASYIDHQYAPFMQQQEDEQQPFNPMNIPCIVIANHIGNCPICSRYYNSDRTGYVVVIIILAIVCLLLLKRVLAV